METGKSSDATLAAGSTNPSKIFGTNRNWPARSINILDVDCRASPDNYLHPRLPLPCIGYTTQQRPVDRSISLPLVDQEVLYRIL